MEARVSSSCGQSSDCWKWEYTNSDLLQIVYLHYHRNQDFSAWNLYLDMASMELQLNSLSTSLVRDVSDGLIAMYPSRGNYFHSKLY